MPQAGDPTMWREMGRTVRYALASNPRTVRLIMLIIILTVAWQVML